MKKFLAIMVMLISVVSFMTIPSNAAENKIDWTNEERAFIKDHPVVKLGVDPKFIPFEYIDENGNYKGIATDYITLISERTGIKFEVVPGLTWPEAYDKALAG